MAENMFDRFTVFFTGDKVFLDGTAFRSASSLRTF